MAFRARYIDPASCSASNTAAAAGSGGAATQTDTCLDRSASPTKLYGLIHAPNVTFHNYNTLVRSSSVDRTILSARSFLQGAFYQHICFIWLGSPLKANLACKRRGS